MFIISDHTLDRLLKLAQEYYISPNIRFEGDKLFDSKGRIKGVVIEKKNGRFRLVAAA
jgi:hypothetical protein